MEVGDTTADPIIGICDLSTQILIFKRYSIYRLYGDRPSYYTVERVEKFTENMSNAGVAVKTDIPYWLTKSGIKLFNGADMQLLDGGQNYLCSFIDTIKTVSQSKAFTANGKLYFTCRVGSTGTYDDSVIVYDTVNGTYMVRDGFKIADMCAFENTIYLINDTGYLYEFDFGDLSGWIFRVNGTTAEVGCGEYVLEEGDAVEAAGMTLQVLHTPGHTPGGVCYELGENLFTGDTMFDRGYGRTDLPGGDEDALSRSLRRLMPLRRSHRIFAGHEG